jgi:Putative beta-barrel porin-2, OmpL-like. bbp2
MTRGSLAAGIIRASILGAVLSAFGASAHAADLGPAPVTAAPVDWWATFKYDAMIEGGITGNPDNPPNSIGNFGQLFQDKANEFMLNQSLLTAHRDIDPKKDWDVGVKVQFLYGSDARYTHFLGELDDVTDDRNQLDILEDWVNFKTPWLGKGGMEIKIGQYVTLEGAETIDPRGNFFYSHSYLYFFGIPFKHTGIMTTTHLNDTVDIYAGADTGVNTSFGPQGDPNDSGAFHGGIGLHLLNNNLNILATTHIGPENPKDNTDIRYLSDITAIWKLGPKLTSMTDFNYIHDEIAGGQSGGGITQYFTYSINDWLSAAIRGEFWRDPQGFWVAAFPCNLCFEDFEEGNPNGIAVGAGPATYTELTFGLNVKPFANSPKNWMKNLLVRPEVRWDHSFDTNAYDNFTNNNQFTVASDFIVTFQ